MSLTITIPGAVDVTTGSTAPATLTIGVGVPGAAGPQGPAGPGVPAGGTAGQYLQKIDGTNYNTDWVTLNLSAYLTTSAAASTYYPLTNPSGYITSSALVPYLLSSTAASTYQPISGMSSYLTTSAAASTYATIAQGQPASGTIGQVLTKNSGTNYDSSWQTLIPGDRYLTTSTTSNTVSNGTKTFTVGTGLSYSSQQDVVISYDASNHMHALVTSYNSGTGVLVVDVNHHTGSGTYTAWTVNVGGMVPLQSVEWGEILGTLGNQTDLSTALNAKLDSTTAASTYAPIASPTFTGTVTIPSGASISGFAPLASPALTGNVTINSNSTGAALFIEQAGTGNILTLHDQATDTNFVAIDANGKVNTIPSEATNGAGFNVPHGAAPTTPVNGDVWTTTSGLFARINGGTQQFAPLGSNNTFSNASSTYGSSTATGTIGLATGATISGSTKTVNIATSGVSGSTTLTTIGPVAGASTTTIGATTAASTLNLASGATLTATTKAVNIGTAGLAGSTTNIAIGSAVGGQISTTTVNGNFVAASSTVSIGNLAESATIGIGIGNTTTGLTKTVNIGTAGLSGSTTNITIGSTFGSTTTLQGTTNGVTPAADTNSVALATTAYVVGQAGSATPLVNGTAAVGTSLRYARQDHVHPTDTTRAALASPTFTGVPAAPTAAVDTNTTQLATTAYVVAQAAAATPLVDGTAAVGTSLRYARADHVHPTDTTRAAVNSPALTGVPTAPTATAGTNTTQIATTAFVQQEVPAASTTVAGKVELATFGEAILGASTTLAPTAFSGKAAIMSSDWSPIYRAGFTVATSGTGAAATLGWTNTSYQLPNTGVATGHSYARTFGISQIDQLTNLWGDDANVYLNFAKRIWISGRSLINLPSQANWLCRVSFGKVEADGVGDLNRRGLGWKYTCGTSQVIQLMVHNGTTLTTVNSSFTPTTSAFSWDIVSEGNGNVTLYINGSSVATTSSGPSNRGFDSQLLYQEEAVLTAASVNTFTRFYGARGAIYVQR
jgi:hypothetical protein